MKNSALGSVEHAPDQSSGDSADPRSLRSELKAVRQPRRREGEMTTPGSGTIPHAFARMKSCWLTKTSTYPTHPLQNHLHAAWSISRGGSRQAVFAAGTAVGLLSVEEVDLG